MRKAISRYLMLLGLIGATVLASSCKKNFGPINTDPSVVVNPNINFLLTYSEDQLATYMGTEYVYETMEQFWRFTQHIASDPYDISTNVNTRYSNFYLHIMPNLVAIRQQIDMKADSASYANAAAVTYILQILQAIKVTDVNGSMPYTQAEQGRSNGVFDPVYDTQEALFNTWLSELNAAIATLSATGTNQESYGSADIFYGSDWTKWINLANTLKLRIAVRWENQNPDMTKTIFQQVMTDPAGPISTDAAQLSYLGGGTNKYPGPSTNINYRSIRYASKSIIAFMKASSDPRIGIYFSPNSLTPSFGDTLAKYSVTAPSFVNTSDPLIMYQGCPADFTTDETTAAFRSNPFVVGSTQYFLLSTINRWFMAPNYNRTNVGAYTELLVSNAESCLMVAELIQKGYGAGISTNGTANDWYVKGVTSSIKTMNSIAQAAVSTTAFSDDGTSTVNAYLGNSQVKLNGTNDLERIYVQEHLNFFRNMNEGFIFCRRTGYPKYGSTYYPRETFNESIPRRWWLNDPGEPNTANWMAAMTEEGFTPNAQDLQTLSTQRVWYDKTAPDLGGGQ